MALQISGEEKLALDQMILAVQLEDGVMVVDPFDHPPFEDFPHLETEGLLSGGGFQGERF